MRIMKHDPHPTRRYESCRTPGPAPDGVAGQGPRPPGDRSVVRRRLVAAAHRPPPGLPPAHQPRRPQGLPRPWPAGVVARPPRTQTGPAAAADRHRRLAPAARPGTHLDQPPTQCGPGRAGHRTRATPGTPLPPAPQGRLPPHRLDRGPQAGPGQGRAGQAGPGRLEKKRVPAACSCTTSTSAASRRRCRPATVGCCPANGSG